VVFKLPFPVDWALKKVHAFLYQTHLRQPYYRCLTANILSLFFFSFFLVLSLTTTQCIILFTWTVRAGLYEAKPGNRKGRSFSLVLLSGKSIKFSAAEAPLESAVLLCINVDEAARVCCFLNYPIWFELFFSPFFLFFSRLPSCF